MFDSQSTEKDGAIEALTIINSKIHWNLPPNQLAGLEDKMNIVDYVIMKHLA